MECKEIKDNLSPFLEDLLEEKVYQGFQEHLSSCPACENQIRMFGSFTVDFRHLSDVPLPQGIAEEVLEILFPKKPKPSSRKKQHKNPLVEFGLFAVGLLIVLWLWKPDFFPKKAGPAEETQTSWISGTPAPKAKEISLSAASRLQQQMSEKELSAREMEELGRLKRKIDREKKMIKAGKMSAPVPIELGLNVAKEGEEKPSVEVSFFKTPAQRREAAKMETAQGMLAKDTFHWHVLLPSPAWRQYLAQALTDAKVAFQYQSAELVLFEIPVSRWPNFIKSMGFLSGFADDLKKLSPDPLPAPRNLRISLVLYVQSEKEPAKS